MGHLVVTESCLPQPGLKFPAIPYPCPVAQAVPTEVCTVTPGLKGFVCLFLIFLVYISF